VLSWPFPSLELSLFFLCHGSSGDGETFAIGKLNHNTKQIPPRTGLSKDIIDRVLAGGFGAAYPSVTETYFFNLFRSHAVSADMINPILWPKQLIDQHRLEFTMASNYRQVGVRVNVRANLKPVKQIGLNFRRT
jgi:hypothetical protein